MASSSSLLFALALFAALHFAPPSLAVAKCIKLSIKNGLVRLRSRGRIARFVCNAGYILYGEKYAACMNNRWDVSPPLCIRPGCAPFEESFKFGEWHSSYNKAVLRFTCDPGLRLVGSTVVFCDGLEWSTTIPYCIARNIVQVNCDLEGTSYNTTCGWTDDPKSDFLWRIHQFSTPSAPLGTGPSHDHTLGPGANGHYLYLETSGAKLTSDKAKLFSPVYPPIPNTSSTFCFVFWYHMYGSTIGELNVYLNDRIVFEKKGNQGNRWLKARIPLAPMKTSFQVVLEGTRGTGYVGDIAVDDFSISRNVECSSDRDYRSCRDRCNETTAVDPSVCHCHPGCFVSDTCCSDIHVFCVSEDRTAASPGQGYSEGANGGTEEAGDADGQEETTSSTGESETEVYSGEALASVPDNALTTVIAVVAESTPLSHETTTTRKHQLNTSTAPSPERRIREPVEIATSKNVSAREENTTRIPFREKMNKTQLVSNNITTSPVEAVTRNSSVLSNGVKYYTVFVENATESYVRETSTRDSEIPVTEDVSKGYEEYGTKEVVWENRTAGRSEGMETTGKVIQGTTEHGDVIWIREELHKTGSGTTKEVKVVGTTPGSRPATIFATLGVATEGMTHELTTVSTHDGVTTRGTIATAKTTTPYVTTTTTVSTPAVVTTAITTPTVVTTRRTTRTVVTTRRTTPTVVTTRRTTPTVVITRRTTPTVVTTRRTTPTVVTTRRTTPTVVTQGTTVTTRGTTTTITTSGMNTTPKVLTTMEVTIPVANTTVATLETTPGGEQVVRWWDDYQRPTDKWKSKWKPKSKVEAVAVIGEEGDGRGGGVALVVVGVVILTALAVLLVLLGLRFRRLRRPSPHDPATDVLFLASDEALDFTVARPDNGTAETLR